MGILFLLSEHGDMTFEQLYDIMGASTDSTDLQMRLNRLEENDYITAYKNEDDITMFSLNVQ